MRSVENKKAWMTMAALAAAVAISPRAMAQSTYRWDSSGTSPILPIDGSGNWDLSTPDWAFDGSDVVWPNNASVAAFGDGGTAGTVTVQTPVNAGAILFNPVSSGAYSIAGTNAITLTGTAAIGVLSNANISAPIAGSLGLIVGGNSTLNLSGINTYTGATTIEGGTLQLGSAGALPSTTALMVNSGATLDTNNQAPTVASLAGAGNVILESGSNVVLNQSTNTTFSGTLTGSGILNKEGAGTLTLTAPESSFTGTLALTNTNLNTLLLSGNANINNGSISVTNTATTSGGPSLSLSNLATAVTAPITVTMGSAGYRFTLSNAAGTNNVISSPITADFATTGSGGEQFIIASNAGSMVVNSNITAPSNAVSASIVLRGASTETYNGLLTLPSAVYIQDTDAGTCYFNPQSGSTWGVTLLQSTFNFAISSDASIAGSALPAQPSGTPTPSNGILFGGGRLQLVNYDSNLSFVSANMDGVNGSIGTSALTLGAATGAASTFSGSIDITGSNGATAYANGFTFVGPGTLVMNPSQVVYPGATTISGGTLQLGNSSALPATTTVTISSGAKLDLNGNDLEVKTIGTSAGNIMLTNGATLQMDAASGTLSGVISGTGQLYIYTGNLTLSGNNTYSGGTTIGNSSSVLTLGSATGLGTGDVFNFGTLAMGTFSPTLGSLSGNGASSVTGTGNLTVGSDNNSQFFSGAIKNTGSLTVVGTGTFTLSGSGNTYGGATNVNSGTLQLGASGTLPTTTALTVASAGTFDMQGNSQQVASLAGAGSIINTGALTIGGTASTTFSGTMASGGSLTFAPTATGTLTINSDAAVGGSSGIVDFASGSAAILKFANYSSGLSFNNAGNIILGASTGPASTLTGAVTGSGSLTFAGPGVLVLSSTGNTYSGGTTITSGNLQFAANALPSGAANGSITITAPGALDITGAFTSVTGTLPLISSTSTGAVALMGDSAENIDFTGYSSLSLGAAANSTYTGTITPGANGYNLGGGGATLTLPNTNALTGGNNLVITSSGTVALTGTNNLTGAITLNAGTLAISSDAAINNGTGGITFSGGTLQFNNYSSTSLPAFNNVANLKLGAASGAASTLNEAITGTSVLTYVGPGTLLLGSGVTLPTTSALTVSAGTLDLNGTSQAVASLAGAGTINTETGSTLTNAMKASTTFSGTITGSGGFTINNSQAGTTTNTLTVTGANTLTGSVNITQSTNTSPTEITLSGNGSFNSASAINITNSTGTGAANCPTINLSNLTNAISAPITINLQDPSTTAGADLRAFIQNTAGANTISGPMTFNSANVGTSFSSFTFLSTTGPLTLSGPITVNGTDPQFVLRGNGTGVVGVLDSSITMNSPTLTLAKTDTGTWVLDPAVGSTWTAQSLGNGGLQMGRANVLPAGILMPLTGTSTLDLNGFSQTVAGLTSGAGSEIVTSTNGAATLTIAVPASTSDEFGSASSDALSGPLTITIAGPGTETFGNPTTSPTVLNNANTYTGGTNLNGGTLVINNTSTVNNLGTGPISFNGGAITYNGTADTYDLTTNGLTINSGGATINVGSNTVTFANAIAGAGPLTKSGTGSLTLNQPVNFSALTASAGTVHLVSGGNTISGTFAINGSSTVQIDGNTTAGKLSGDGTGTLNITAGKVAATAQAQSTLDLKALSISPGAVLDLDNGNLAINYGTGTDPYTTIIAYIKNGYDQGNWDGSSPVNGSIESSASAGKATTLGYADNTTTDQVQVKYTWYGDLNLDGVVNSADLDLMSSSGNTWGTGDLNYDGVVNADDWALFMLGDASQNGSIGTGVPEPSGMALIVAPIAAGLTRRRRAKNK